MGQQVEFVTAGWLAIGKNDQASQQFFHGLLCRESPVFRWKLFVEAESQRAEVTFHNP